MATLAVFLGCADHPTKRPGGLLELQYREARLAPVHQTTATQAYRGIIARSLGSHCRMWPSDSQLFDRRAHSCGAPVALYLGMARVLLEVSASTRFLSALALKDGVHFVDLPVTDACQP